MCWSGEQLSFGRQRRTDVGRGFIAFVIALVIAIYGGMALKEVYRVRSRAATMTDFVEEELGRTTRMKLGRDDLHFALVKKAKELGIMTGENTSALEVVDEGNRFRVRYEWDDKLLIPGINYNWHFAIDKTWTRF